MYRMKCGQTEIAFCLFVIKKTKQWGLSGPPQTHLPNQ